MSLLRDSFNPHIVSFFETSVLKEVRILRIIYPQCSANNGDVLTPKFQNQANLLYDKVFHSLFFLSEFLWKTQNLSESMFLHNRIF